MAKVLTSVNFLVLLVGVLFCCTLASAQTCTSSFCGYCYNCTSCISNPGCFWSSSYLTCTSTTTYSDSSNTCTQNSAGVAGWVIAVIVIVIFCCCCLPIIIIILMVCGVFGAVACLVKGEERNATHQPVVVQGGPQPVVLVPQPGFVPQQNFPPQPGVPLKEEISHQEGSTPPNQPFIPPTTSEPPPYN